MFWKLVKYELQSVRKWYLGIYGIASYCPYLWA